MARWEVKGANKGTGAEHVLTLDANSKAEATQKANRAGLLVESIEELGTLEVADLPVAVPHQSGAMKSTMPDEPDDHGVTNAAGILNAFAVVLMVLGIIDCIIGFVLMSIGLTNKESGGLAYIGVSILVSSLPLFIVSAAFRMFAGMGLLLSDIARRP